MALKEPNNTDNLDNTSSKAPKASTDDSNYQDLGFGSSWTSRKGRFIKKDGSFNIKRIGGGFDEFNLYHTLVEMPWLHFLVAVVVFFVAINSLFACLHLLIGIETLTIESNSNTIEDFLNALFFSIQTFTSVGYGSISPIGIASNIVASVCALVGLMSFALVTGLLFARFSKPAAKILYSESALIAPYQAGKGFMFRLVNQWKSELINIKIQVTLTWIAIEKNESKRHFARLSLERDTVDMLPLSWTIVHPLTTDSPFYGKTLKKLEKIDAEIIVILEAYDKTFNQQVHSQHSYTFDEIKVGYKFKIMYYYNEEGTTILELKKLNAVEKVEGFKVLT